MQSIIVFIFCLFLNNICCSQIIPIPDSNFKNRLLLSNGSINGIATNAVGNPITINTNGNNEIEVSEALNVYRLFVQFSNINDLTGIEHFTNLILLQCANNNLSNIENTSQLNNLIDLNCSQNNLNTLNLENLSQLKNLFCKNNQISTLDFSNNPQLEVTYCGDNQLSSLDFSNNPLFHDLGCKNNPNLTTLKIKNNTIQLFGAQTWSNECWTGNPNLTTICADDFEIAALQSYLAGCGINTNGITINSDCALGNEEFINNKIVLYPNPAKDNVTINSHYSIENITLIDSQGRILLTKKVNATQTTIDVSGYSNGVYFVKLETENAESQVKLIKN